MSGPSVFLIDDDEAVRRALSEMLRVFGYTVETFVSAGEFLDRLGTAGSGCVVADVCMPGMNGIELVRDMASRGSALPVVIITGHGDVPMAVEAIKAGAEDFIEKPVDDRQLVAAINRGIDRCLSAQRQREDVHDMEQRFARLTPREVEVFDHVVKGYTNQAIAMSLGISARTVESYRLQVMEKMGAHSVAALVRDAVRLGRIAP
jgi:two-component system response regulator FixJ